MSGNIVADTLHTVTENLSKSGNSDSGWILHHIMDERALNFEPFGTIHIPQFPLLFGIDITPTKHTFFMLLGALLVFFTFAYIASR